MIIQIFLSVILPIFALIGIGVWLDRKFTLDLPTLSRLNFYVFVPALCFVKLLEAKFTPEQMVTVGMFSVVHVALLFLLAWVGFTHPRLREQRTILTMGTIFYNAGNYGIPLVALAFGDSMIGIIAIILVVQNLLNFTLGIWLMERNERGAGNALAGMLKVPVVPAVALALLLRGFALSLPAQIMSPLHYLADGLIPIALLTLGAQLARTRLSEAMAPLASVTTMRLLVSPLLAALLIPLFHFTPPVSSVLIVAVGFPVAVNVYILAAEYRQNETLASQSVFLSTLISGVTLSILLVILK